MCERKAKNDRRETVLNIVCDIKYFASRCKLIFDKSEIQILKHNMYVNIIYETSRYMGRMNKTSIVF